MNLPQWGATHQRSLLFLLLIATVAGAVTALRMPVALFPNVSFPRIAISIDAADQSASQMIALITRPVEQAVKAVPGLREVRSTTSRGSAELSLNFDWGINLDLATLQVQSELDRVLPALPAGVSFDVRRMNPFVFPVAAYSLTSDTLDTTRIHEIAQYELLPLLSSINGVARVEVFGGGVREFHVDADPLRLAARGLDLDQLLKAITEANSLSALGRVEDRHKLLLTLADNRVGTLEELRNIVVRGGPDGAVRVSDLATVSEGAAPNWTRVTADGHGAVILQVKQQPDANTVQLVRDVAAALHGYASRLPPSLRVSNWYDQSELISGSARSVFEAVLIGTALAAVVLFAFLRSVRVTLITVIVVPAVLLTTVLLLRALNMSFNIMTLGGMAAAIGLIIDDAIVMLEQIERGLEASPDRSAHIRQAAREFLVPLAGSSAATTVIFVPLAFLSGVTGAFFKALSLTLASALIISFFTACFVVPLLAEYLLRRRRGPAPAAPARFLAHYRTLLQRLHARRWLALLPIAALLLLGIIAYRQVGTGFMPSIDEGGFVLDYIAPPGTSLADTDALLQRVETILRATSEVQTYSRRTGLQLGGGLTEANAGDFFVRLKPQPRRAIEDVMIEVRTQVERQVPGLEIETAQLMEDLIGDLTAVPEPIEIKLFGDDPAVLASAAPRVAKAIAKVRGVTEIRDGVIIAGDALDIHIDPVRAAIENITPAAVAAQLQLYLSGGIATQIQGADHEIDVRVGLPLSQRGSIEAVRALRIRAEDHQFPLSRIAEVRLATGQPELNRDNLKPLVAVTARIEGRDLGGTLTDVKALLQREQLLPPGTYYELGGLYAEQQSALRGLLAVLVAAFALVFLLLLFLYESFRIALAITAMPLLAMAAVFVGLWLTGIELNISAMMGMTMVVGIVTEIAIFYCSEYRRLRRGGLAHQPALLQAGSNRLRPIAMTTIAAMLALLPLALAIGQGAQMQQPLAVAIIAGLIVQMPLVLLLLPLLLRAEAAAAG